MGVKKKDRIRSGRAVAFQICFSIHTLNRTLNHNRFESRRGGIMIKIMK